MNFFGTRKVGATSNLDSITESTIEDTIQNYSEGITSIIIAHRLSTIMRCDMIYVIEKGNIIEAGNHEQLIKASGKYAMLWEKQTVI